MDFHQLIAKMQQLDQPVPETQVDAEPIVADECGEMPANPMGMPMGKPDTPPPSMSLNLNAQGLDNIEELMKLIKAVNPDAEKPMGGMPPSISIEPMDKPMGMSPLKMLPDLDAEEPGEGPEDDSKEKEEEAFGNSLNSSEPETMDVDSVTHDGDDLHKKKSMYKAAAAGDNPMAAEGTDLRAQIRAELLRRLEEAKGAK